DKYDTVSTQFLGDFYWHFLEYLQSHDLDEPEDTFGTAPPDSVRVMTVHQAKGLEFPVVFVTSLGEDPRIGRALWIEDTFASYSERNVTEGAGTRAERDLVRQFYVAHSRAEEDLILLGTDDDVEGETVSLGYLEDGSPLTKSWFESDRIAEDAEDVVDLSQTVGSPRDEGLKRPYSVVGDLLAYRRCKRQYGFHVEYGHETAKSTQLFAGTAVHQTLDMAHRHYAGDIEGVEGGKPPTDDELKEYFDEVVEMLGEQGTLPLSDEAIDRVFESISRFNREKGSELYPRVRDTECRLSYYTGDHVIRGDADVVVEDDEIELWDYKAASKPDDEDDEVLNDYRTQVMAYSKLYHEKNGEYPDKGVIYFMNEEPEDAKFEIDVEP
ncbi:MAG: PD-(D/E)XK nuclease family protein, partial [Halobacteria archaeon]|nr:PD-(D/E)XK nuclease family protein [Halobacteria archaeon]